MIDRMIARELAREMPPEELHETLRALGWSMEELARVIRVAGRSVRRWGAGEQDVPYAVALAIRLMAQAK